MRQVASHAQKYFIRMNSGKKNDKRRSSIHDITSAAPSGNAPPMPRAGSSDLPSACCASLLYQEHAARVPCQCSCGSCCSNLCYRWAACRLPSCACHVSLQSDGAQPAASMHEHSGDALLVFCRRPGAAACADKRLCAAAIGAGSAAAVRAKLVCRRFGRRSCAERRRWWAGRTLAGAAISVQISGEGGCLAARAAHQ